MNKLIRKNQKKLMAVFGVGLMIMFIKGLVPDTGQSNQGVHPVGTLGGTKVLQTQITYYTKEWQDLRGLYYVDPNHPDQPQSLVAALLGNELANRITQSANSNQSSPLYFLLLQEAVREGISVPLEELQSFVTSVVRPLPDAGNIDDRDRIMEEVSHCLMIQRMLDRASSVAKVTRPMQQLSLASRGQILSIKFSPFLASSFLKNVPEPTDAQIHNQFDQYSDKVAAEIGKGSSQFGQQSDPLGFGYKIPDRVQVQYVGVNHTDVHDAAIASKSKEDWYVAAYGEFKSNREDYDSRELPPTTQPAERIEPSTQPASAHPAASAVAGPRKVDNLDDDFALHADLVLTDLYERETEKLQDTIVKEIAEKMSSGFGTYRDFLASHKADATAGPSPEYITFKFMQDIAAGIRSKYGITPILGNIEQFKSETQLGQIPGIGRSLLSITGSRQQIPFQLYATGLFQPLMSEAMKNSSFEALSLAPWQASNPLNDEIGNVYVFRVSGSDPAHTPPLADVKEQVVSDWKINAAYEKAMEAAHLLLSSAQLKGLDAAAAQMHLSAPIVTDPFQPDTVLNSEQGPATIAPLNLLPDSARELANDALQLLTTTPGGNNRPQLLAELYPDRIISVIELHEAKPAWDSETKPLYLMQIIDGLRRQQRVPLMAQISTLQAVSDRLGYQPDASLNKDQSE